MLRVLKEQATTERELRRMEANRNEVAVDLGRATHTVKTLQEIIRNKCEAAVTRRRVEGIRSEQGFKIDVLNHALENANGERLKLQNQLDELRQAQGSDLAQARADAEYQQRRTQSLCEKLEAARDGSENARLRELLHEYRTAEAARAMVKDAHGENELPAPGVGSPCCICDESITTYDSYGVSDKQQHRYHWSCVRREAATVSAPTSMLEWAKAGPPEWRAWAEADAPLRRRGWTDPAGIIPPQNGARS